MIDQPLLVRRALRWACDQHGLRSVDLPFISQTVHQQLEELCLSVADDMLYNQLKYFRPFNHQMKFFATGNADRRGVLAANQIGRAHV